jgi:hypothetical protein
MKDILVRLGDCEPQSMRAAPGVIALRTGRGGREDLR